MDRGEYEERYQNYCRSCKGWGIHIGIRPDINIKDCECMKQGRCPRCGSEKALNNMYKCGVCGWDVCDDERGLPGGSRVGGSKWVTYDN